MASSTKLPKGRHLTGDHVVYDVDASLPGELLPLKMSAEAYKPEEIQKKVKVTELLSHAANVVEVQGRDSTKHVPGKVVDSASNSTVQLSPNSVTEGEKQKGVSPSIPSIEASFPQILAMQESLHQVMTMQKEILKQMSMMAAVPVTKEDSRLEAALVRSVEKSVKANVDAQCARFQEEIAKIERRWYYWDRVINLLTDIPSMDLQPMQDKMLKEVAAVAPTVAHALSPLIEKSVPSAVTEVFQSGIGYMALNQLERSVNSELEASVVRQIQEQFQTNVKQVFQEAMNSASSLDQTLSGELAEGQTKLLAPAGAVSTIVNALATQLSNEPLGGLHEKVPPALIDPTKELSRLISESKYEDAFTAALQRGDANIVSWLCSQADLERILDLAPIPLSQSVLLSLLQQLACDFHKDTPRKVGWMLAAAAAINPFNPVSAVRLPPIAEEVSQKLQHHRSLMPNNTSTHLLKAAIRSLLRISKTTASS